MSTVTLPLAPGRRRSSPRTPDPGPRSSRGGGVGGEEHETPDAGLPRVATTFPRCRQSYSATRRRFGQPPTLLADPAGMPAGREDICHREGTARARPPPGKARCASGPRRRWAAARGRLRRGGQGGARARGGRGPRGRQTAPYVLGTRLPARGEGHREVQGPVGRHHLLLLQDRVQPVGSHAPPPLPDGLPDRERGGVSQPRGSLRNWRSCNYSPRY